MEDHIISNDGLLQALSAILTPDAIRRLSEKRITSVNFGIDDKKKSKVSYCKLVIGKHKMEDGMNIFEQMVDLSKNARWFFSELFRIYKENYYLETDKPNIIRFKVTDYSNTDRKRASLGYSELVEKDIVRRYKNGWYMINPDVLAPFRYYEEAMKIWESLKKR